MRRLQSLRRRLTGVHNHALACVSFSCRQMSGYVTDADHRMMMAMQSCIGRNSDPEHSQLGLSTRIALIVFAIPRLRRLQNLLHIDSWLARTLHSRDKPKG